MVLSSPHRLTGQSQKWFPSRLEASSVTSMPRSLALSLRSLVSGWYSGELYQAARDCLSGNSMTTTRCGSRWPPSGNWCALSTVWFDHRSNLDPIFFKYSHPGVSGLRNGQYFGRIWQSPRMTSSHGGLCAQAARDSLAAIARRSTHLLRVRSFFVCDTFV